MEVRQIHMKRTESNTYTFFAFLYMFDIHFLFVRALYIFKIISPNANEISMYF